MFGFFKPRPRNADWFDGLRDTLFGDIPLSDWPRDGADCANAEPWSHFIRARREIDSGNREEAISILKNIIQMPGLETRHYLQAWHFLRTHGVNPPTADEKKLLGIVVENALPTGLVLLAAYADRSARIYSSSGNGTVWTRPNDSLDQSIDLLMEVGQQVIQHLGPWKKARPAAPRRGEIRLNFLAPSGQHFGQGPFDEFSKDPMASPVITLSGALMKKLRTVETN